jgi:FkbM family methyltransferase
MIKSTRTRYCEKFFFYANDEMIGHSLSRYGEYSQSELTFLLSLLTKNAVVYDVGANIGYHTTAFASVAKHVYAFEPHPRNYAMLKINTTALHNVTTLNCAVSQTQGHVYVSDFDPEQVGNFGAVSVTTTQTAISVPCLTLDQAGLEPPDLIKIDVEGSELNVLQGCQEIIAQRCPVIYYEAHESKHLKEIYEMLQPMGYRFYWAQVNNYNPDNFAGNEENIFGKSALMSIMAWPKNLPELAMTPVLGPEDTANRFYVDGHP